MIISKNPQLSLQDRFEAIKSYLMALGDNVQIKTLKYWKLIQIQLQLEDQFSRDARNIGHYDTGDLELTIYNDEDFEEAKWYIHMSYVVCTHLH